MAGLRGELGFEIAKKRLEGGPRRLVAAVAVEIGELDRGIAGADQIDAEILARAGQIGRASCRERVLRLV